MTDSLIATNYDKNETSFDVEIGVIYTYESRFMGQLLATLRRSCPGIKAKLLLVDNDSNDGVDRWSSIFETTTVIKNDQRLGYAENLNRILAHSGARYTLLLNTDMYFDPQAECVSKLVQFMDGQPDCGVSGCRLYHEDGSYAFPARRFHSIKTVLARRLDVASLMSDEITSHLYQDRSSLDTFDCDWLSGCLLMIRRDAYLQVGDFDVGFKKYFEDEDFCLRVAAAGWRVMFFGGTFGYHLEQRASKNLLSNDAFLHIRSYWRWLRKWGVEPVRSI